MSERMSNERAIEILEKIKSKSEEYIKNSQTRINTTDLTPLKNAFVRKQEYAKEKVQALDIAIESLEHQVNEKDEIKLVCPKCKREWTKPIGEFCSSCGTEMVVEPYERKE